MQLRWKTSFSASCLHAAACMQEGLPIVDTAIAQALHSPVTALVEELAACGFAVETTLPELTNLAADYENNRQLAEMAAKRILGAQALSESAISRLAGSISDLEAAWLRKQPQLVEELAVRGRPLREQWEARGPGLLRAITKLTSESFVAPAAEVVLVSPVVGGHGRAHLQTNRVTLEAVLTHPDPELPEPLRLGWLLAQLNLDVPANSEPTPRNHLSKAASLAALPLTLAAAEVVELTVLNEPILARALDSWHCSPDLPSDAAEQLLGWWHAYASGNTRWPVAMAALAQMFAD